jgi:GrpB-like predicted nucleotidyltransferase (UPF0157 family)
MKKYEFKPYNRNFPELFDEERNRLFRILSEDYQIEHIGSTAVPGLGGKGIIDIMVAVPKGQMQNVSKQVQDAGYIFRPLASTETRLFLRTEYPADFSKETVFHLHVTFPESADWIEAIEFRNYLRTHPEDLRRYAEIKKMAAQQAHEKTEKYKSIKDDIVKDIVAKAVKGAS